MNEITGDMLAEICDIFLLNLASGQIRVRGPENATKTG